MINNDNIFAIEEYKPEQSTEDTELMVYAGLGLSVLVLSIISKINKNISNKKDRKILEIIDKHLDIIREPIKNDLKKFLPVYKKLEKNEENIINKLKNIDKYGLYQPTDSSDEFENHGEPFYYRLRTDDGYSDIFDGFAYDIIKRILGIVRGMKRKDKLDNLDFLKDEINDIKYRHSFVEGKMMYKSDYDDGRELSEDEEKLFNEKNRVERFNKIAEQITSYCKSISKNIGSLEVKSGFINGYGKIKLPVKKENEILLSSPGVVVEIYLTMPTSITYEHLVKLIKNVKHDLYNKGNK